MFRATTIAEVVKFLENDMASLHPKHRVALERARISPRKLPVSDSSGEYVVAIAALGDKVLYWSDVEEGWEIETPDSSGSIPSRGCNQFELRHVMYQVLGDPDAA